MIIIIFVRGIGRGGVCPNGAVRYCVLMLTNPPGHRPDVCACNAGPDRGHINISLCLIYHIRRPQNHYHRNDLLQDIQSNTAPLPITYPSDMSEIMRFAGELWFPLLWKSTEPGRTLDCDKSFGQAIVSPV